MVATGLVGGFDVGTGVLALLTVERYTGSKLLGGLAFSVGFIALALASSELFTEDFLVPVSAVVARKSRVSSLVRLWALTLLANLAGGWVMTTLIMSGLPGLDRTALADGSYYAGLGFGWRAFALALLAGIVMTLMTWMQHSSRSVLAKTLAAGSAAFLLVGAGLSHAIVGSLLMFAALHTGRAPFDYLSWLGWVSWAALGNLIGGLAFVTLLRLLQVHQRVAVERSNPTV